MVPEVLLLPAPQPNKRFRVGNKAAFLAFLGLMAAGIFFTYSLVPQKEILASIALDQHETILLSQNEEQLKFLQEKNDVLVRVLVDGKDHDLMKLQELGITFETPSNLDSDSHFHFQSAPVQASDLSTLRVTIDHKKWKKAFRDIRENFETPSVKPQVLWEEGQGWTRIEGADGLVISDEEVTTSLSELIQGLEQNTKPAVLHLATSVQKELLSAQKRREINQLYTSIKKFVKEPLILQLAEKTVELDLNQDKDFVKIQDGVASLNEEKIQEWIENFAEEHFRAPETVKIVGKEEVRAGVNRAVLEGQFVEGRRIKAEEVFTQIREALEKDERTIVVKTYEIPVKVYSEIEQQAYELLSVGYSEFSTGNAPNRVHNVKTGLDRINGLLVDPGKDISFNKSVGSINSEFRIGYGIFGSAALPVLGGGICQASTTFYRALLNLGVPITQRQNHSWDLSYYQAGGYGLDATIFPEMGLDVKAINDLPSQLLFYSYIRPETEEAFVLIYGKGDGRKVTLEPEKEYVPFKGPKTLKWKQTVELPTGEIREEEIVSRYRA